MEVCDTGHCTPARSCCKSESDSLGVVNAIALPPDHAAIEVDPRAPVRRGLLLSACLPAVARLAAKPEDLRARP
eukprot:14628936-Alexandrium_andersonii.AAC.1